MVLETPLVYILMTAHAMVIAFLFGITVELNGQMNCVLEDHGSFGMVVLVGSAGEGEVLV